MRLILFISTLLLCQSWAQAQTDSSETEEETPIPWVKASDEGVYRLGIKMGFNLTSIYGSYPIDKGPRLGLLGGGFGRINFNKILSLQHEVLISFRGGRFNGNSPDIGAIKYLYLDFPLLIFVKPQPKSQHRIGTGIQFSHALNKLVFQDNNPYPADGNIPLDNNDWAIVTAYQYQLDYVAFQIALKGGLRNLNLGGPWPGNSGTTIINKSGTMHNFALEFNLIF
jgi:hypothetical protein